MDRNSAKKWFLRSLLAAGCLLLAAILILSLRRDSAPTGALFDRLAFRIEGGDGASPVTIYCVEADDGQGIVYLPACARPEGIRVRLDGDGELRLNGEPLRDGMSCDAFPMNEALALTDGDASAKLTFVASGGVSTMFVDTLSGDMEAIDADKTHKEAASVALYDAGGSLAYRSFGTDKLRGRGQWSWKQSKKSYNLYLDSAVDLLGMGGATKWALVANILDQSSLRNWLVYSTGRALGSYDGFAPECAFVDLYLNGRYNGLYLLCEKVELQPSRLNPGEGSWLFDFDLSNRMNTMRNPFKLDDGLAVEIKAPAQCSREQKNALRARLLDFQAALLSERGVNPETGRDWSDYIDLDSFARKYLIEEIFQNYDAGAASQYFFWNSDDDRIYAGPCWDYDNTLGVSRQRTPNCFLALREWKSPKVHTPWFPALWGREAFRERVVELYRTEFLPALQALMAGGIDEQAKVIEAANRMNQLRWAAYYEAHSSYHGSLDALKEYLQLRVAFLNSAWIDGVDYRTVTFDLDGEADYQFYCLPAGSSCEDLPSPRRYGLKDLDGWLLEDGTPFDPSATLDSDMTLYGYDRSEAPGGSPAPVGKTGGG